MAAVGPEHVDADPMVRPAGNPKFGDYQANLAMGLAKRIGQKPRDLAEAIVSALDAPGVIEHAEVAGPGFINLTLSNNLVIAAGETALASDRLNVPASSSQTVVVDYASPNLAKEMHIGHLRSTIIGDSLARVFGFLGDTVTRQNHIGDWGTQFGMLLEHLIETGWDSSSDHSISDLNALYQSAKKRDDNEPDFAERARKRVVALQAGEAASRRIWQELIGESVRHMNRVFEQLGVQLTDEDIKAESFYNDKLEATCDDLEAAGVAKVSEGALCVFVDGHEHPLIVRKSDGGYGYATTDLAAVRYRVADLGADRAVYVVDSRQRDHFNKFFAAARQAGWAGDDVALDYVPFGTILGKDKRPFKTREGGTVKLVDVLDEAVQRAGAIVAEKNPELSEDERAEIARVIGVGAVKYADLSNDRIKDYVFDWDRMLAFDGNTAPYLINAYVRIRSIFRKAEGQQGGAITLAEPAERALALKLTQLGEAVASVGVSLEPHRLCTYLYELAGLYHKFYEACPVLRSDVPEDLRASRLALCEWTGRTLKTGLGLLGIGVVERM